MLKLELTAPHKTGCCEQSWKDMAEEDTVAAFGPDRFL